MKSLDKADLSLLILHLAPNPINPIVMPITHISKFVLAVRNLCKGVCSGAVARCETP